MSLLKEKKYQIYHDGHDIMFVINVPADELDESTIKAFVAEVHSRNLEDVILPDVEQIIRGAQSGEAVRIGGHKSGEAKELDSDADKLPFGISVEFDGLEAWLEVEDPLSPIKPEQVWLALERNRVVYGLVEENIEKFISRWPGVERILVAMGRAPVAGEDATLGEVKHIKTDLTPTVNEEGQVDFKHLNLISPVEKGEVIQVRTPPTPGQPGMDVGGNIIPSIPGKDIKLHKGENTRKSEDNTKLLASKAGFLHKGGFGKIDVRSLYTVQRDVDYSTGNIEYKGDVLVKGDVRAGFTVISGGDVIIKGAVEDAVIEAEGDVVVKGGVVSSGSAVIKAGGDISVGFVQHSRLESGGSVFIKVASMGTTISARKDVEVLRREGRIYGGEIEVGGWVVAQAIGCETCPTLRIKFRGLDGAWGNPDDRYRFSFVSTNCLDSPLKAVFGPRVLDVKPRKSAVNVSVDERRIVMAQRFIGPGSLEKLRRQRAIIEGKVKTGE